MAKGLLNWKVDFSDIGEIVGTVEGIAEAAETPSYMAGLIRKGHSVASREFDLAAASAAGAGYLSHMYEFGTAGISRGPVKFTDPTALEARLWTHQIDGQGNAQSIYFAFRPAINRNPQPTTKYTGVPSKYLKRLSRRKYVFRNKAMVMETGQSVEIMPRNGRFLFVPFMGEASSDPRNRRGYMMWDAARLGPIRTTPGVDTKGQFTSFWTSWWNSRGNKIISDTMNTTFASDVGAALAESQASARGTKMTNPSATNLKGNSSRARTKANMTRKSNSRRSTRK